MHLAFFGHPGSGKSSISNAMIELTGGVRLAFADALRAEVSEVYGIPLEDMTTVPKKYEHRKTLQDYGNGKRASNTNYWVEKWLAMYEKVAEGSVYVDDVRFPNEYQALKTVGFTFVKLNIDRRAPDIRATEEELKDVSEMHWPSFDFDVQLEWDLTPQDRAKQLMIAINNLPPVWKQL